MSNGASPSGKAAGFGPAISEVRILSPQPINSRICREFFVCQNTNNFQVLQKTGHFQLFLPQGDL